MSDHARKGNVVFGAKLTATGSTTAINLSLRQATNVGVPPPAPPPIGTPSNQGISTMASVTTNVVLRMAIVLIDPLEELDDDQNALEQAQRNDQDALLAQQRNNSTAFLTGLRFTPAAGEQVIVGAGTYDLIAALPYQTTGIHFTGTLTFRDLSPQGFNAQVPIALTTAEPDPFLIIIEREARRRNSLRTRSYNANYAWLQFQVGETASNTALADARADFVIDVPEEHFRRQRIYGSSRADGKIAWHVDLRRPTAVAVPEGRYLVCRIEADAHIARNKFVIGVAGANTNDSPRSVPVRLWTPAEVRDAMRGKSVYFDSGHGIAYGHDKGGSIRCQEWYVVDRALNRAQRVLEEDWGIPTTAIFQSRSAGLMFDQYMWTLDFGSTTVAPRSHRIHVTAAHSPPGGRPISDLIYVLALSTDPLKTKFLSDNTTTITAIVDRLAHTGRTIGTARWQGDEFGVDVTDAGITTFTPLKALSSDVFTFGGPTDREIFINLIETRLADETMDICLRENAEITLAHVEPAWFDRSYIKRRMVEHARLDHAFDYMTAIPADKTPWIAKLRLPPHLLSRIPARFRHNGAPKWSTVLMGWTPTARQRDWAALRPAFNGTDGIIVSLHLNGNAEHRARGTTSYYNPSLPRSRTLARIMEKYVDPLEAGVRLGERSNGIHAFDGNTFGDMQASDVFLEIDFYNSLTDADLADPAHNADSSDPHWLLFALDEARDAFGMSIAEAVVEGLCYTDDPTEMDHW